MEKTKIIYTKKGEEIIVDEHRYEEFIKHQWYINGGYAIRKGKKEDGDRYKKTIALHREVLGIQDKRIVDHIDRNKLNNVKSNLRECSTNRENLLNSIMGPEYKTSKYKGVCFDKKRSNYLMSIKNGNQLVSMRFDEEIYAGGAYDYYAKKFFGEFAYLNNVNIPKEVWVDHIVTRNSNSLSSYKGVTYNKTNNRWQVAINKSYIGSFATEEEAGLAYNIIAIDLFGENADLNIIDNSQDSVFMFTIKQRPLSKSNMYKARAIGNRAIVYTTREMEDFQIMIGGLAQQLIPKTLTGFYSIYTRCYSTKRLYDVDNPLKAILDSLDNSKKIKRGKKEIILCEDSGIENDKNFWLVASERFLVDTPQEERVEVIISPYRGIFNFANLISEIYARRNDN